MDEMADDNGGLPGAQRRAPRRVTFFVDAQNGRGKRGVRFVGEKRERDRGPLTKQMKGRPLHGSGGADREAGDGPPLSSQ